MELSYEREGWICVGQDGVRRKYFVLQLGIELQCMRYRKYFDQLMVFNLFKKGFVSWIRLGIKSEFLSYLMGVL
jgi:hypothetical protein